MRGTNHLAVWVSAIIAHVLGALWYGPVFGNAWMKFKDFKIEDINPSMLPYVLSFISCLLVAYVISWLFSKLSVTNMLQGILMTMMFWLVFNAFEMAVLYSFQQESLGLLVINAGKSMIVYFMYGVILSTWRSKY